MGARRRCPKQPCFRIHAGYAAVNTMCDSTKENDAPMTAVIAELQALTQKNTQQMEALLAAFPQLQPREVPAIEAPPIEAPPTLLAPLAIEPAPADQMPIEPTPEEPVFDEAAATEAAKKLDVVELCAALEAAGRPIERAQIAGEPKGAHLALVSRLVEAKRAAAMAVRRDVELAPPPPPASTPEPGAQAQEMQLIFDNNQNFVAYHEVVPGKTFDDLKALFPTDEEWEMFVMAAASYLPREV